MADKLRAEQNDYFFRLRAILNQPRGELNQVLALDFITLTIADTRRPTAKIALNR